MRHQQIVDDFLAHKQNVLFKGSLEPQISECEQSDMSGSSGTISCEVWYPFEEDLASILVNVTFLLDDDSFRDSAVENELGAYKMDITLKDLVPGSRDEKLYFGNIK